MDTTNINTYLTDQSNNKITGVVRYNDLPDAENGKILYKGVTKLGNENEILKDSKDFRLRMWLDSNSTETSGLFEFDIDINTYYVENDFVIKGSAPLTLKVDNGNVLTGEKAMTNIITISDGALSCVSSDETIATCSVSGKALVIAIMCPGHFTSGGHFITLTGASSDGTVIVADPALTATSKPSELKPATDLSDDWTDVFLLVASAGNTSYSIFLVSSVEVNALSDTGSSSDEKISIKSSSSTSGCTWIGISEPLLVSNVVFILSPTR